MSSGWADIRRAFLRLDGEAGKGGFSPQGDIGVGYRWTGRQTDKVPRERGGEGDLGREEGIRAQIALAAPTCAWSPGAGRGRCPDGDLVASLVRRQRLGRGARAGSRRAAGGFGRWQQGPPLAFRRRPRRKVQPGGNTLGSPHCFACANNSAYLHGVLVCQEPKIR